MLFVRTEAGTVFAARSGRVPPSQPARCSCRHASSGGSRIAMLHCPSCSRPVSEDAAHCEACETDLGDRTRPILPPMFASLRLPSFAPGDLFDNRSTFGEYVPKG